MCKKNNNKNWKKSSVSRKYPSYRDAGYDYINVQRWLKSKQDDDEAEGLWRIHDTLYDLESFIDSHPGGAFWIKETKGTDITEAFETHHLSNAPRLMLDKYKVRKALKPRNITFTLKEDGFYKTLKSRVQDKLKTIDKSPASRSDLIHTGLIIASFLFTIIAANFESYISAALGGLAICWTVIASHNYFHRKNNWRMYAFNFGLMNCNDWRISHAISHHIYTNTLHDLEMSMFEPILVWVPSPHFKNTFQRFGSWIYGPIAYSVSAIMVMLSKIGYSIKIENVFYWDDLVAFTIPLAMYIFSDIGLLGVLKFWLVSIMAASFLFSFIGLNAAHHGPEIHHDGDADRVDRDWGLFQLDTIMDRSDIKGSQFLVLTHFGDHALHHLFPTLDHGILPKLYPILYETMLEFKAQLKECKFVHHIIGQHKQLARITPNKKVPGSD